ncbi:protein kinase domain-containing protein [Streptomyces sp. 8N706]|uniref:protein kinase domain-containing protein n=1 Tax=Streptomyces sp. 8N706 TaxID=3457416 RepID=UPI003FCF808F
MTLLKDDPTEVGGYRLEGRLGAGGMGVVYMARSPGGGTVALKVIRRQWAEDPEFRARFELEAAAARMVHSRFTAPVVDADPYASEPWMATAYVPGECLATHMARHSPLGVEELLRLAAALARALRDIHRAGVVHRDLKPGNVLLTDDGPRVIDFGIARAMDGHPLTDTGRVVGTPAFMAPEQLQSSDKIGPEADVFSLGCVLAFAATGRSPFEAGSPYAAAYQVVHEEPDLADVPDSVRALVAGCLAKDPADRPSPEEMLERLGATSALPRASFRTAARRAGAAVLRRVTCPVPTWVAGVTALAAIAAGAAIAVNGGMQTYPQPAGWRPWETRIRDDSGPGERCTPAQDAIYCQAGNRTVMRVNTADGTIAWKHTIPVGELEGDADGDGQQEGPDANVELLGVSGGRLWYAQHDTDYRRLRVLDTRSGQTLWTRKFSERPLEIRLTGPTFFLVFSRRVEAIDVSTKAIRWTRHFPRLTYMIADAHGLYLESYRAAAEGRRHTTVAALHELTGTSRWAVTMDEEMHYQTSVPGVLYFRSERGDALVRLDTRTRKITRTRLPVDRGDLEHKLVAHGDLVCWGYHDGTVILADSKAGIWRWRTNVGVRISATPTLVGQQIYLAAADGSAIALDTRSGEQIWKHYPRHSERGSTGPWSRPPVMAIMDRLYAVSSQGDVYTVR